MPGWVLTIIEFFGPKVVVWALTYLESKWPGTKAIVDGIIEYISSHPNPPVAIKNVRDSLATIAKPSDLV